MVTHWGRSRGEHTYIILIIIYNNNNNMDTTCGNIAWFPAGASPVTGIEWTTMTGAQDRPAWTILWYNWYVLYSNLHLKKSIQKARKEVCHYFFEQIINMSPYSISGVATSRIQTVQRFHVEFRWNFRWFRSATSSGCLKVGTSNPFEGFIIFISI